MFKTTTKGIWKGIKERNFILDGLADKGYKPVRLVDLLPDFHLAIISNGVYNTKDYFSKVYTSKPGLLKGLKSNYFFHAHKAINQDIAVENICNGETWNCGSTQFKISFSY